MQYFLLGLRFIDDSVPDYDLSQILLFFFLMVFLVFPFLGLCRRLFLIFLGFQLFYFGLKKVSHFFDSRIYAIEPLLNHLIFPIVGMEWSMISIISPAGTGAVSCPGVLKENSLEQEFNSWILLIKLNSFMLICWKCLFNHFSKYFIEITNRQYPGKPD